MICFQVASTLIKKLFTDNFNHANMLVFWRGFPPLHPELLFWLDPKSNQKGQGLVFAFPAGAGILFVCCLAPRAAISLPQPSAFVQELPPGVPASSCTTRTSSDVWPGVCFVKFFFTAMSSSSLAHKGKLRLERRSLWQWSQINFEYNNLFVFEGAIRLRRTVVSL
jgi:hypothetical protein